MKCLVLHLHDAEARALWKANAISADEFHAIKAGRPFVIYRSSAKLGLPLPLELRRIEMMPELPT